MLLYFSLLWYRRFHKIYSSMKIIDTPKSNTVFVKVHASHPRDNPSMTTWWHVTNANFHWQERVMLRYKQHDTIIVS